MVQEKSGKGGIMKTIRTEQSTTEKNSTNRPVYPAIRNLPPQAYSELDVVKTSLWRIMSFISILMSEHASTPTLARVPEPDEAMDADEQVNVWHALGAEGGTIEPVYHFAARAVSRICPQNGLVLDLGCGSGRFLAHLAELRPDIRAMGFDLSPHMVDIGNRNLKAKGLASRVTLQEGDMTRFSHLVPAETDVITSVFALHHLPSLVDLQTALGEINTARNKTGAGVWLFDLNRPRQDRTARLYPFVFSPDTPEVFQRDSINSVRAAYSFEEMSGAGKEKLGPTLQSHLARWMPLYQTHWLAPRARVSGLPVGKGLSGKNRWVFKSLEFAFPAISLAKISTGRSVLGKLLEGPVPDSVRADGFDRSQAFSRNLGLVQPDEQRHLQRSVVAIAGLGGVGGVHLTTLARLGIGGFHIADFDTFEIQNFNRQAGATVSSLGRSKVEVMASQLLDINPTVRLKCFNEGVHPGNIGEFLKGVDVVVDGLDFFAVEARELLFEEAERRGIPLVTAGPIGMSTAWLVFRPGSMSWKDYFAFHLARERSDKFLLFALGLTPRATQMSYMDRRYVNLEEQRGPSLSLAVQLCAGVAATEVVKLILGRGKVLAAPYFHQFDAYKGKLVLGKLVWGNRGWGQRLKILIYRWVLGMGK